MYYTVLRSILLVTAYVVFGIICTIFSSDTCCDMLHHRRILFNINIQRISAQGDTNKKI
jgi:hypothetical protein